MGLMEISRSTFQAIQNLFAQIMNQCYGLFCKVLGDLGYVWEEIVYLKGFVKFRQTRNIEGLMQF